MTGLFHCRARAMASSVAVSQACRLKTMSGGLSGAKSAMLDSRKSRSVQPRSLARLRHLAMRAGLWSMPMSRAGMFRMLLR